MFEYKVIPAPTNGTKAKGVKTVEGRFAMTLETLMNKMGSDGWEFQRAETLPSEERSGLMSKSTTYRNVLVFRRSLMVTEDAVEAPVILPVAEVDGVEDTLPEPAHDPAHDPAEETFHETVQDTIVDEGAASEAPEPQPLVAQRD